MPKNKTHNSENQDANKKKRSIANHNALRIDLATLYGNNFSLFHHQKLFDLVHYKNTSLTDEEFCEIENNSRRFLRANLPYHKKSDIENMLHSEQDSMLFRDILNDEHGLDPSIHIHEDKRSQQYIFKLNWIGMAIIKCPHKYKIVSEGFEFCTGFFLYNPTTQFCLVGHLPLEESMVVDFVDNILYPLLESLKKDMGISLKQSRLMLCCGIDGNYLKDHVKLLPGQLVYYRIQQKCLNMFSSIIFSPKHIINGDTTVVFNSDTGLISFEDDKYNCTSDYASLSGELSSPGLNTKKNV